jgi:large subunit ribosomal protein L21
LTAVIVSGGKQYRVAPGDRILVDRLAAEAGSEITISRVLLVADGEEVKLAGELKGLDVTARVIGHPRGPKIDVLRYKSKKRVRVHRGARADLTALEIVEVAGRRAEAPAEAEEKAKGADRKRRGRVRPEVKADAAEETDSAPEITAEDEPEAKAAKPPARRRTTKAKKETSDGP